MPGPFTTITVDEYANLKLVANAADRLCTIWEREGFTDKIGRKPSEFIELSERLDVLFKRQGKPRWEGL